MSKYRNLDSGDVFPAYWTDAIQEFLGTLVAGLRLTMPAVNIVRVVASSESGQVTVGVSGLFRYRSTNSEVTVSGATSTYNLYVAVSDNDIAGITDATDYNWYLYFGIIPPTGSIAGGGTIYATRKIGELDWNQASGSIVALRQTLGAGDVTLPISPTATNTSVTPLVVSGASAQSADLVSVGSTAASTSDRLALDAAGKLSLPVNGASAGLLIGDADLYRSATTTLRTDNHFVAGGNVTVGSALTVDGDAIIGDSGSTVGFYGTLGAAQTTGWSATNVSEDKSFNAEATTVNELANVVGTLVNTLKATGLIA